MRPWRPQIITRILKHLTPFLFAAYELKMMRKGLSESEDEKQEGLSGREGQ